MSHVIYFIALTLLIGCSNVGFDIDFFQPPITVSTPPPRPITNYSLFNNTTLVKLGEIKSQIPAFNGKGSLLASWTPHPKGSTGRPTFVVVHGGHGLGTTNFASAVWLRDTFDANVLVLDSYWSRGQNENWATQTRFGANMRVLDVIAAGRWLRDTHLVDTNQMFVMGDSQGGWTVLRTFTDDPQIREHIKGLYRGGIAAYPNCFSHGTQLAPTLSPYIAPVIIFTGGKDTATPINQCSKTVLDLAFQHIHYPDQTHGWDVANRGAAGIAVDGECTRALNIYNKFPVCRSDATTNDMYNKIKQFVTELTKGS
ncbi:MAG: prolyl oligopeptidase family serine peptidase [Betaproteobacteria bacterium]|jgi:dienelactone hydrolase|nr:dienelactone hydrolase [Betaproteobacteria bacterium]NDE11449.1 dienelactone hydrolase [Chitinophagia bacterium]